MHCKICGKSLTYNEIGLHKKLIGKTQKSFFLQKLSCGISRRKRCAFGRKTKAVRAGRLYAVC